MKSLLLFFSLFVVALSNHIEVSDDDDKLWENFKTEYGKNYASEEEEQFRKTTFLDNLKYILEHNFKFKIGLFTFDVGTNEFADLNVTEFSDFLNGYKSDENQLRSGHQSTLIGKLETYNVTNNLALPSTVDWRTKGAVTGVKNQRQCGSCWAFSATGALEGQTFIKRRKLVSLSEQNLVDCSKGVNQGCNGGLPLYAFQYVKNNGGIDTEGSYPYTARDGTCRYNAKNKGATANGYVRIPSGSESKLQEAVALKGPISVAIDAGHRSIQLYRSGIYKESQCSKSMSGLNHAVLAVGYGSAAGGAFWTVKNSWGTSWGMAGYILIARNSNNMCGIATDATYPVV